MLFLCYPVLLPAALRAAQICRYLVYSEADFEVFRPAGATRCTFGPLLRAKFHPRRCNDKCVGPPKLKFLLRFDRNVKYKRPAGAYPLRDFHKNLQSLYLISGCVGVKISLDLLKGLWSYGGFKLRGRVSPTFSAPPSGETTSQTTKRFRGERTCSRSSITMPSLVGLGFHPPP